MDIRMNSLKAGLTGQVYRNNVVANNLANVNTTGFKKDFVFFQLLDEKMDPEKSPRQVTSYRNGDQIQTSNSLDVAIQGDGFFTVQLDDTLGLTRDGHFHTDGDGVLRTANGYPVLGRTGEVVLLGENLEPGSVSISHSGEIFVDDVLYDQLRISTVENSSALSKRGHNLFVAKDERSLIDLEEPALLQGFLEGSNVNAAEEMINLIELEKHFESMQKMVRSFDESFHMAAVEVGKY